MASKKLCYICALLYTYLKQPIILCAMYRKAYMHFFAAKRCIKLAWVFVDNVLKKSYNTPMHSCSISS